MFQIFVQTKGQVIPGRRFRDHGVGPDALRTFAISEYLSEVDAAQYTANVHGEEITIDLINIANGRTVASQTVRPKIININSIEPDEMPTN